MVSPNPSSNENELTSVSADSPTDAWAVGTYLYDTRGIHGTLTLHWDGTSWSKVKSPNPSSNNRLDGVSAKSATDAWAAGTTNRHTMILHWDGSRWSQVRSPNPSSMDNKLLGMSSDSATDAWAAGDYDNAGVVDTLILHWDGTAWSQT